MSFVQLSTHVPRLWQQPSPPEKNAVVLVFDHIPEGYRKACAWICKEWDRVAPVYRLLIPCSPDRTTFDLCDFERTFADGLQPKYTGIVEAWPESTVFGLQRIRADASLALEDRMQRWPPLSQPLLSDDVPMQKLVDCGYASERALLNPHPFTGLTTVQVFMLRQAQRDAVTVHELIQRAVSKFRLLPSVVSLQLERLAQGNVPWVAGFGDAHGFARGLHVCVSKDATELMENPMVPPWLMNGPFPVPEAVLARKLYQMLVKGKTESGVSWTDLKPECEPHQIEVDTSAGQWVSTARRIPGMPADDDISLLPYGVSLQEYLKTNRGCHASWRGVCVAPDDVPPHPIKHELVFAINHTLIGYDSVQAYVFDWFERKLDRMTQKQDLKDLMDARVAAGFEHLREIYVGATIPRLLVDGSSVAVRAYLDESDEERKTRLINKYGAIHFDYLWNLPLRRLRANVFVEEDDIKPDAPTARARWQADLKAQGECEDY